MQYCIENIPILGSLTEFKKDFQTFSNELSENLTGLKLDFYQFKDSFKDDLQKLKDHI